MPRLVLEEPQGDPAKPESVGHRKETKRDNVVVVLKAATFALVVALFGAGVLLATAGEADEREGSAPPVPEIGASASPAPPATTTPLANIVAPEVRSQTAVITPPPPSSPSPPSPQSPPTTTESAPPRAERPPGRSERFAVVGRQCDTPGAYAFTERYEPVVCAPRPNGKAVWHRVFE